MPLSYWSKALLDFLLPRYCVVCGRRLFLREDHLCTHCVLDFPYSHNWDVERNKMSNRLNEKIQAHIVESDNACHEPFARAISLFLYHTETNYKKIPYNLKYNGAIAMGKYFARALARKIKKSPLYADVDLIIPVPLYWFRKWKRGYNQAEIIAKEVSKELDVPMDTKTLKRLRNTTTQTKLEVADKSANVDRAFKASIVDKTLCERRHILIIDDVFTTGSTLASCQWELRKILGPDVRISVATLAYVD